ncbi:MAG: DUF438 domain-containing protein [Candidatus Thorarchaeota archaeon]
MTEDMKSAIKRVLRRIHNGEDPDDVKREFAAVLRQARPADIAQAEEELVREGLPREEIQKLCEVHLSLFGEGLERKDSLAPEGHPIYILMREHEILLEKAAMLSELIENQKDATGSDNMARVNELVRYFRESANHYLREENVLFPILEKHGITEPPKVMWMEHDQIRALEKQLYEALPGDESGFGQNSKTILKIARELNSTLSSHFYKENNILFPTSIRLFTSEDWQTVMRGFDEVGYCFFSPERKTTDMRVLSEARVMEEGIDLGSGTLPARVLRCILNTLPVDITFVDDQDRVRYFSESPERIFVRSRAVIGRSVQMCHPQKSVHIVNRILEDFRNKKRDVAEFWIDLRGRKVHIRYFAVRDEGGRYLGCLEVSQDITEIKKLEGEKRLLDDRPA